ncbi:MAG: hypothetical protein IT381_14640 [Deltaproteobacteria bacterium]|nr:hypothetical protein [Deltaproteobacteria bacterium]
MSESKTKKAPAKKTKAAGVRPDFQRVIDGEATAASVLGLGPKDARHLLGFAAAMLEKDQLETAEAAAEVATNADPMSFDAWMVLGAVLARKKEAERALAAYAHAAEIEPNSARLWCDVGELKLSLGDEEGAAKALGLALKCDPKATTPGGKRAQAVIAKTYEKLAKR